MAQLQPYMPFIVMALVGLIAGWLAGLLLGGGGLIRNLIVGLIGSFVGGFLVNQGILKASFGFNSIIPYGDQIAVSTIGAVLIIIVVRILGR